MIYMVRTPVRSQKKKSHLWDFQRQVLKKTGRFCGNCAVTVIFGADFMGIVW